MLKLAKNLDLPTSAVTQTFAFLGKRGGGKTYGAMKLAEEMLLIGAQIVAFDVVGKWYGLRIPKDGRHKPFDIVIFGGLHADIEINPKAGKIVAGIVMQKNLSAVLDLSQFIFSEQVRFMYDFLVEAFEYRKAHPAACHFIFEEAAEVVPENLPAKAPGENYAARLLSIGNRVVKLGRNFGIGVTLIAQRPQEVNKKVLNMAEVLLAFQMVGLQEKETIHKWTQSKGDDTDVKDILPKLEEGNALIFSPTWLKISGTYKIAEKITADVSATPQVGVDFTQAQKLEPRDVTELSESIKALTAEMEANTPAALKKRIAELERDLKKAQTDIPQAVAAVATKEVIVEKEVPIVPAKEIDSLTKAIDRFRAEYTDKLERIAKGFEALNGQKTIDQILGAAEKIVSVAKVPQPSGARIPSSIERPKHAPPQKRPEIMTKNMTSRSVENSSSRDSSLSAIQLRILEALAELEVFGIGEPTRNQLGFYQGNVLTGGSGATAVGELRNRGLVEIPRPGVVTLTDSGRASVSDIEPPQSLGEFHNRIREHLDGLKERIFNVLVDIYPDSIARADNEERGIKGLGPMVNAVLTGGSGATAVSDLKTAGLLVIPQPGFVRAADVLFPEGLN